MGISLITALIIKENGNDILCHGGGPNPETGKYVGWIALDRQERGPRPLLNTQPIYSTEAEAKAAMEKIVEEVRKADLP